MYGHAFRTHSIDAVLQELQVHKGNMYTSSPTTSSPPTRSG
jgi:hypothetical protein